jgi:transcriptional regulator GlxA family with amidase domain
MGRMREELARLVEREPRELPARFERFLETVAVRSGYRLEPARAHVEAGFERMAAVLVDTGTLDAKSLAGLTASLERSAREARTVDELYAAYRLALRDIVDAVENPVPSRQDRSLRRAEAYLRQHYAERFALARVARAAGFAPNYFSQLWKKTRGMTVEGYVTTLRLERAKELLTGSALAVQRVAQLSGFGTRRYLARVFKRATGEAPIAYRRRVGKELTALGV